MEIRRGVISKRYLADGIPLETLNVTQKEYLERFLKDTRLKYKEISTCPLCGRTDFILIAEKDRYGIPLNTVVCKKCGLIFTQNQLNQESALLFYKEYYRKIYEGIEHPTANKYKRSKTRIPRSLKNTDIVVEIGAGGGWNLMRFKREGFRYYGFDYDKEYIKFGRDKYGLNLFRGGVEEAKQLNIKADCLILYHVLEHTSNPQRFLLDLKSILSEKAIILIGVPSASLLIVGGSATGYELLGTLQNAHNFLFDNFTLKYLALHSGYGIKALLGETMILTNKRNDLLYERLQKKLEGGCRGDNVIKHLKLCERLVPLKKRILFSRKLALNLHYLYYAHRPLEALKIYFMKR